MKKTVIVCGAVGFLGNHIVNDLIDHEWEVIGIDKQKTPTKEKRSLGPTTYYPITLPSQHLERLLSTIKPDLFIHAAGTASVRDSISEPLTDYKQNVDVLLFVLDAIRKHSPKTKLLFLSSAAVYGNSAELPIREDAILRPVSPYGFHKLMCEKLIEEYHTIFGVLGCSVRIFSAYGPGLRRQILWDICTKISKQHKVQLMGSGRESRDLIHATDVAKAIRLLGTKAAFHGETYNLASGTSITIREIAEELIRIFGAQVPLVFTGEHRLGDPLYWQADIRRISKLGFKTSVGISDGLNEYATWFMNNE
jgi:UDP-glucose 4-epimerase